MKLSFSQFFAGDAAFGSVDNPIRIALVPSQEAGKVINSTGKLIEMLRQKLDIHIQFIHHQTILLLLKRSVPIRLILAF